MSGGVMVQLSLLKVPAPPPVIDAMQEVIIETALDMAGAFSIRFGLSADALGDYGLLALDPFKPGLVRVGNRAVDRGLVFLGAAGPAPHLFQARSHSGQWGTQIMGNVIGDLAHRLHQSGDAIEQCVESTDKLVELVTGAACRKPSREIATHDLLAHLADN